MLYYGLCKQWYGCKHLDIWCVLYYGLCKQWYGCKHLDIWCVLYYGLCKQWYGCRHLDIWCVLYCLQTAIWLQTFGYFCLCKQQYGWNTWIFGVRVLYICLGKHFCLVVYIYLTQCVCGTCLFCNFLIKNVNVLNNCRALYAVRKAALQM